MGVEIVISIIEAIVEGIITAPYEGGISVITVVADILDVANVFQCESIIEGWFGVDIGSIVNAVFMVAYWFLILKFVWKGFDIYILGGTGDEDSDPMILLINFIKALAISLGFGVIFEAFMNIAFDLFSRIKDQLVIQIDLPTTIGELLQMYLTSLVMLIMLLVYLIMVIILTVKFMKHTFELVILRIGISFAASGLLDSDQGVFKPYIKKFFQITWTVLLQAACFRLSLMALAHTNLLPGIMALSMAIAAPQFLSEFIMTNQGGGKLQQAIYSISILRSFAR